MAFDKEGEWVTLNPIQTYLDIARKAEVQCNVCCVAWDDHHCRKLHDEAAAYYLACSGIPVNEENLVMARDVISRQREEIAQLDEENGFSKEGLSVGIKFNDHSFYKHEGD